MEDQTIHIKSLLDKYGKVFYPKTSTDAVLLPNGNTLQETLGTLATREDLLEHLSLSVNSAKNRLELKLDNTVIAYVNRGSLVNILTSGAYNNETGELELTFTNGTSVSIDIQTLLIPFFQELINTVETVVSMHTVLSETEYEQLEEKDPNKFYYTYEDD